jgi:hypothetical protein
MSEQKAHPLTNELRVKYLEIAHSHYKLDVEQIWKRGTVFLTISSALIAFRYTAQFKDSNIPAALFRLTGLSLTAVWLASAYVSLFWIRHWRAKVQQYDDPHPEHEIFNYENVKPELPIWPNRPQAFAVVVPGLYLALWLLILVAPSFQHKVSQEVKKRTAPISASAVISAQPTPTSLPKPSNGKSDRPSPAR